MLTQFKFKQLLFALVLIGLLVRFVFIFAVEQIPVMWDARIYSSAALGLIQYVKDPDRFGHPENDGPADSTFFRAQFEYTMKENIQGEQIEWLYYDIPTVTEAQDYLFLSGPVYPIYLSALFFICPVGDFELIRILNVIIDSLCLLLLVLIARRLFGDRTSLLAGLLYIFYLPFVLVTGMVSPEPIAIVLILLTAHLILAWYDRPGWKLIILIGAVLGILTLVKPTAVLLFIPFGAAVLYDYGREIKKMMMPVIKAAIPFVVIILPWLILTSSYYGELSFRDPDYSAANLRSSSSIVYEGYDLDYTDKDFWISPVMQTITEKPIGYAGLLVKKFLRLWAQPYNDFKQSFIFGPGFWGVYHFLIVITGLFGIFIFCAKSKKGSILLLFLPLYYTGIHVVFHALARYNLNAMPFVIIASAAVLIKIYEYIQSRLENGIPSRLILNAILVLIGILMLFVVPPGMGVRFWGGAGVYVITILKIICALMLFYFCYRVLSNKIGRSRTIKMISVPVIIILLVTSVSSGSTDNWAGWKCRLDRANQAAGVRIYVPDSFRLETGEGVRIGLDMVTDKDRPGPFYLTVNGQRSPLRVNQPPISQFYYKKMTYNVFQTLLDIGPEEIPSWRFVPLNPAVFNQLLDRDGYIDIIVENGESGFVDLGGGYNIKGGDEVEMPSLTHSSIERFVEKGDPRMWVDYILSSDSAISYYIDDTGLRRIAKDDLSPSAGRQFGRYRIILEVKRLNEARYYF